MKAMVSAIAGELFTRYPKLSVCRPDIINSFSLLRGCYNGKGKALICGNGGSASDSEHIVGELMKNFLRKRPISRSDSDKIKRRFPDGSEHIIENLQGSLPAISLVGETAMLTAYGNDCTQDMEFAQQVFGYGRPGDVLIGISTSGNSANVVNAAKVAVSLGIGTVAMTGSKGGTLAGICDAAIRVPEDETFKIQELHLPVYHTLCAMLEEEFFGE